MPAQSPLPDPERILHDVCHGAISGAVFSAAFSFLKGLCCSPSGHRLASGVQEVATSTPRIARWAAKSGVQEAIRGAMADACGRDDHWNSVVAYGCAAALFSVHVVGPVTAVSYGLHAAAQDAAFSAFIHLFRFDHRCSLPEPPARYAARFPGFPVASIAVEEVWADESGVLWKVHPFPSFPTMIDGS
ncbi:hypothetical protein ACQ4PT_056870 [Festuca glaucescens]